MWDKKSLSKKITESGSLGWSSGQPACLLVRQVLSVKFLKRMKNSQKEAGVGPLKNH